MAPGSRSGSTSLGPNACLSCSLSTYNKASLECYLCHGTTHAACLSDWSDYTKNADINKLFARTGLKWYCGKCEPTLNDYISGSEIRTSLKSLNTRMQEMSQLVCENIQISKTHTTIASPDNTVVSEIKAAVERIDASVQSKKQHEEKEERACNAVLHGLAENNTTLNDLTEICDALHFHRSGIVKFVRRGRRNMSLPSTENVHPVKLSFNSEVNRKDFMHRYSNWQYRENKFCTPDLTPEERDWEFKLRKLRDNLKEKFTNRQFQVRNGAIYARTTKHDNWTKCEDCLDTNIDELESVWDILPSSDNQSSNGSG